MASRIDREWAVEYAVVFEDAMLGKGKVFVKANGIFQAVLRAIAIVTDELVEKGHTMGTFHVEIMHVHLVNLKLVDEGIADSSKPS